MIQRQNLRRITNALVLVIAFLSYKDLAHSEIGLPSIIDEEVALGQCKSVIPIAKMLNIKIVDKIKSPRPHFECKDFMTRPLTGSVFGEARYSIVRISNERFCDREFCYTFVYNKALNSIVFSTEADVKIEEFHRRAVFPSALRKIVNHAFENTFAGLVLNTSKGPLQISIFDEVIVIGFEDK